VLAPLKDHNIMPANIDKTTGTPAVMTVGPAWHRLGKVLDAPATAADALKFAHLDWPVSKAPLFVGEGGHRPLGKHCAIVREDAWRRNDWTPGKTDGILGVVGKGYEPLQNEEAFRFFDPIVGEKAAAYHTAGALGKGERVWILAKLPEDIRIIGDDIANKYLLLSNSHDGSSAVQIKFTPIRVVCHNTLTLALNQGPSLRVTHTRDLRERLMIAQNLLSRIRTRYDRLANIFQLMATVQVDRGRLAAYLKSVFPGPIQRQNESLRQRALQQAQCDREGSAELFEKGRGNDVPAVRSTLWAAYNGVAEYIDYRRYGKASPDRQLNAIWFGEGYSAKARSFTVAEKFINAWVN
jgi:phage/plasmid-like protein (TIGR03299 family)